MCRTHLEHHLLFAAQVEGLKMSPPSQIPHVHLMTVFAAKKQIRLNSVFDHVRRSPFAGEQGVESQVPPEIVMQKLWAAVDFPLTQDLERFAIEQENTARAVAIRRAEGANVNTFRSTMNGVRTRVIRACKKFLRFEHLNDLCFSRVRFRVDNVDA